MDYKSPLASAALAQYINETIVRETPVQKKLRAETAKMAQGGMQISPDQGSFLSLLAKLVNAKRALEVGTFTGYSALCIAAALPDDGKLICCDISAEWTKVGEVYWREAGLDRRIELRLGQARQSLESLLANGMTGTFDFAFIDADKTGYDCYYELTLRLLRQGGLMVFDNMLRHGAVANALDESPDNVSIRNLSSKSRDDARVDSSLVSIGDGFLLARKK